jgi:hypothetical protein
VQAGYDDERGRRVGGPAVADKVRERHRRERRRRHVADGREVLLQERRRVGRRLAALDEDVEQLADARRLAAPPGSPTAQVEEARAAARADDDAPGKGELRILAAGARPRGNVTRDEPAGPSRARPRLQREEDARRVARNCRRPRLAAQDLVEPTAGHVHHVGRVGDHAVDNLDRDDVTPSRHQDHLQVRNLELIEGYTGRGVRAEASIERPDLQRFVEHAPV